jgi:CRP/FNR family cyclic AMP-dependent transcriptional regulator
MSILAKIAAFKDMPQEALNRLERGGVILEPPSGSQIITSGDTSNSVYAIIGGSGSVRVGSADRQSKALMLVVRQEGDIFGEIAVLDGGGRTAEAVTEGRVRLLRISGEAFMAVLQDTPSLGVNLCRMLAAMLRRTDALLQDATFGTVEGRLARQLLYLAGLHGHRSQDGWRLAGRFRQTDLADLLGTTPRSIITVLNKWRTDGLVKYDAPRGLLTICDETRLRAAIGPY